MDSFLVEYLKSGKAWVLIGSGPSIEAGYPSWARLATLAVNLVKAEAPKQRSAALDSAMKHKDYPLVFEEAFNVLGAEHVLNHLQSNLTSSNSSKVYELIARWPVPVYLTTNYDDEIHSQLAKLGEAYIPYTNSKDHFSYLSTGLSGAIIKLHGDLRSEEGLILTTSHYRDIGNGDNWRYWRTKLTSIFQLNPVIIIGHSLTDPHIKHILESAKEGAGVHQPICWVAPDVSLQQAKEFLEKYRIRVIPYDNSDGSHTNLIRIIENISQFIFPRTIIPIRQEIAELSKSPLGTSAAAPGFFVFNKLALQDNFDQYRIDIVTAAIQSVLPTLAEMGEFTLKDALHLAGWPKDFSVSQDFINSISAYVIQQALFKAQGDKLRVGPKADELASENQRKYDHARQRFLTSLILRLKRNYDQLTTEESSEIASDIEASLTGFFREGGLSLATTLLSSNHPTVSTPIPSSIIKFINQASARYTEILKRQAFSTVSVDIFTKPEQAERDYLGRISQGFFAFHALGLFGEAAVERLNRAKQTVWIVDSSVQIPALALVAPTNAVFNDCFSRLKSMGIRLFATEKLFSELLGHYDFAEKVVNDNGPSSPSVMAGAMGQPPYRKANQFLEGFVRWQAAGNPCDWESYMYQAFGDHHPTADHIRKSLRRIGIEIIPFEDWPGYSSNDIVEYYDCTNRIVDIWENKIRPGATDDPDFLADYFKKAEPEAEALIIINKERTGSYHIISDPGQQSPAWFVSQTSMLNLVEPNTKITWQPEAFLKFTSTLAPRSDAEAANRAFDTLLLAFTQVGVSLIDDSVLLKVFGGAIDQARLSIDELTTKYDDTLKLIYAEPPESVFARISPTRRPMAAIQLAYQIAETQTHKRQHAEAIAKSAFERAAKAEGELEKLEGVRKKIKEKQQIREHKARQRRSRIKKKRKK